MPLFVLVRHAQSVLNAEGRVNGDPGRDVPLTPRGETEARALGLQLSPLSLDLCVHSRFPRTCQTAQLALAGRDVPLRTQPLLDDVDVGELDLAPVEEYRAYKGAHPRSHRFPGGESLDDAALRYARAFEWLASLDVSRVLVVTHEIPIRYALNAVRGSTDLDGSIHEIPNATPYLFDEESLVRASRGIRDLLGASQVAGARSQDSQSTG